MRGAYPRLRNYDYYINTCTTTVVLQPASETGLLINPRAYRVKTPNFTSTPRMCGVCQLTVLTYFILFVCVF